MANPERKHPHNVGASAPLVRQRQNPEEFRSQTPRAISDPR